MDLGDLPFDMPKLRRRLRMNQNEGNHLGVSTDTSGISQASSSHSVRDENKIGLGEYYVPLHIVSIYIVN